MPLISQEDDTEEEDEEEEDGALEEGEEEEEEEEEYAPHPDCESTILFTNRPTGGTIYNYVSYTQLFAATAGHPGTS